MRPATYCIIATLALAACSADPSKSPAADSAGIRILVASDSGAWTQQTRPVLIEAVRIGERGADPNYQFGASVAADIGSDGSVYVLDVQGQSVRAFDSAGKYLRTISRAGNGPGEISMGSGTILVSTGDTILIPNAMRQSVIRFTSDGKGLESFAIPLEGGLPMRWAQRSDGSVVVQVREFNIGGMMAATGGARSGGARGTPLLGGSPDQLQLRNSAGKVLDTLLTLPAGETMQAGGEHGMRARLFAPEPVWAAAEDGRLFSAMSTEYSIRMHDADGKLHTIIRRDIKPVPVTPEDKAEILKEMRTQMTSMGMPAEMVNSLDTMFEFADFYPAIAGLLAGPDGTIWVQRAINAANLKATTSITQSMAFGSSDWDVFDREGALLGQLRMPDKFTPQKWVGEKLVGVQVDAAEVPNVVVLQFQRARG